MRATLERNSPFTPDAAADNDRETLLLAGGLALMVFGAGLILSNRSVRQYVGSVGSGNLLSAAVPDLERYLKLRSM